MSEPRRERSTGPWALVLSVALHAALLALAWRSAGTPRASRPGRPVEVQIVSLPAPAPAAPQPPPATAPARRAAVRVPASAPAASPTVVTAPPPDAPAAGPVVTADVPRAPGGLLPRVSLSAPDFEAGSEGIGTGRTVRNGPGEAPDPVVMREYKAENAQRALQGDLEAMVAQARTVNFVDSYFVGLAGTLRTGLSSRPIDERPMSASEQFQDIVGTYSEAASRSGRPLGPELSPEETARDGNRGLARAAERSAASGKTDDARWLEAGAQMLAGLQVQQQSSKRARKRVLVELVQDASGALAQVQVLEPSGDTRFDDDVVHRVRRVVRERGDVPDGGVPGAPLGFRSVWRFTLEPPRVGVELIRMSPLDSPPG